MEVWRTSTMVTRCFFAETAAVSLLFMQLAQIRQMVSWEIVVQEHLSLLHCSVFPCEEVIEILLSNHGNLLDLSDKNGVNTTVISQRQQRHRRDVSHLIELTASYRGVSRKRRGHKGAVSQRS